MQCGGEREEESCTNSEDVTLVTFALRMGVKMTSDDDNSKQ